MKKPFEKDTGLFFRVSRALGYPEGADITEDIKQILNDISEEAFRLTEPVALHKILPNEHKMQWSFAELKNAAYICYVLVSAGEKISRRVTEYFDGGSYLNGICLDAVADEIIYKLSEDQCRALEAEFCIIGMGTTERFTPGVQLPLIYQTEIVNKLEAKSRGITTTAAHMISPVKSGTFILGLDANLPARNISHTCNGCTQKNCSWRG